MTPKYTPWEEHQFWLRILEEHATFVRDALSVEETQWVALSRQYVAAFQALRTRLEGLDPATKASAPEMVAFAQAAYPVANGYFLLEGHLQRLRIQNQVVLYLTPTYFNGTLNENAEYLRILAYYKSGQEAPLLPLDAIIDLWLEDQLGHTFLLHNLLDPVEQGLSQQTQVFIQRFNAHVLTHHHLKQYKRFLPEKSPYELRFIAELVATVQGFTQLARQVVELYEKQQVLSRLTLQFIEHHFPETCYFLHSLSLHVEGVTEAGCEGV
ncbi:DUF2935 domain-containing protein [Tumebacillus permanentifrigoris]|uniref:DUF2935 family protein n=1 Tax=Tumebacillus permanentifrigoris TaxID=378543 RepID=A0A316DEV3_9BACL|nr:DUF2935 domain-containing protein [Tumebacillus permanentifrigoris]PWK14497.1 hypothetical protein C7459_105264 [Tumebacillus permanentifrigoris]